MTKTKRIVFDAVLAAVYFALSYLTVNTGSLQFRFTSLALVVAALLFGPLDACAVGLIGEGLYQLLLYPLSVTTPLWILTPVLHGLVLGLLCSRIRPWVLWKLLLICLGAALCNSVVNTLALWADSLFFGYYKFSIVFGAAGFRLLTGATTGLLCALVALPLCRGLKRALGGNEP